MGLTTHLIRQRGELIVRQGDVLEFGPRPHFWGQVSQLVVCQSMCHQSTNHPWVRKERKEYKDRGTRVGDPPERRASQLLLTIKLDLLYVGQ